MEGFRTTIRQDSETIELADPETKRRMQSDPMFRVEKTLRLGNSGGILGDGWEGEGGENDGEN